MQQRIFTYATSRPRKNPSPQTVSLRLQLAIGFAKCTSVGTRCMFTMTNCDTFWFFSRSSKSAFSRHDNVRASSTLFIWLNENVDNLANRDEGGDERKSYLGAKDDRAIAETLQANRFDCVIEADRCQNKDAKQLVLICVKRDGMYRAVIKGEKATLKLVTKDDLLIEP